MRRLHSSSPVHANHGLPAPAALSLVADQPGPDPLNLPLICRIIFSRYLGAGKAKNFGKTNQLCHALAEVGRTRVVRDGVAQAAPFPTLRRGPWPSGPATGEALAVSQRELREQLEQDEEERGVFAALPSEIVEAFFPSELWPVLETLIKDGPGGAAERAERALRALSKVQVAANKRRPAGPPAKSTLANHQGVLKRIFAELVTLREQQPQSRLLDAWLSVPRIKVPDVPPVTRDTDGPPLAALRKALRDLEDEVAVKIGRRAGETDLEALARMSNTRLVHHRLLPEIRGRVALGLLLVTGARIGALAALRRQDYLADHQGPAPEYRRGAAIKLRPGKTLHEDYVRIKPIPAELASWIEFYFEFLDRSQAVLNHWKKAEGTPPSYGPNTPLLVRGRQNPDGWHEQSIGRWVSGKSPSPATKQGGMRPLIPRLAGANPEDPIERQQWCGYNPHAYRHSASQLAERAGREWNKQHGAASPEQVFAPSLWASSLLDHEPREDRLRALYGDRSGESLREVLSGRAADGIWALLATDAGARKRPDVDRFLRMRELIDTLDGEKSHLEAKLDLLKQQTPDGPQALGVDHFRFSVIQDDIRKIVERLVAAHETLNYVRYDERAWIALPDDAPQGSELVDWPSVEQQVMLLTDAPKSPVPLREWVTAPELAQACGVNHTTVMRWINGAGLSPRQGCRPWDPGHAPVDTHLGQKFRRLSIAGISEEFLHVQAATARLMVIRTKWPESQNWRAKGNPSQKCFEPLILDAPKWQP